MEFVAVDTFNWPLDLFCDFEETPGAYASRQHGWFVFASATIRSLPINPLNRLAAWKSDGFHIGVHCSPNHCRSCMCPARQANGAGAHSWIFHSCGRSTPKPRVSGNVVVPSHNERRRNPRNIVAWLLLHYTFTILHSRLHFAECSTTSHSSRVMKCYRDQVSRATALQKYERSR